MPSAETAAWERSEPGSGPTAVYDDPSKDKAVAGGWRRDPYPVAFEPDPFFTTVTTEFEVPYEGGD